MSPAEVAKLMNIPLIKLTWLPSNIQAKPRVEPHGLQHVDDSGDVTCIIRVTYPAIQIDISVPFPDAITQHISVDCYKSEYSFSHCWGEIAAGTDYIVVNIFTDYPPNIAQKIADGVRTINS